MFTLPFWIVFAIGIIASLGFCTWYARRAIHPRLRPHFGQVVVVFLIMVLAVFFIAIVLGKMVGGGMEAFDPEKMKQRGNDPQRAPSRRVEENRDPVYQ
jgi:predicted PurR-regulated permease PerM